MKTLLPLFANCFILGFKEWHQYDGLARPKLSLTAAYIFTTSNYKKDFNELTRYTVSILPTVLDLEQKEGKDGITAEEFISKFSHIYKCMTINFSDLYGEYLDFNKHKEVCV